MRTGSTVFLGLTFGWAGLIVVLAVGCGGSSRSGGADGSVYAGGAVASGGAVAVGVVGSGGPVTGGALGSGGIGFGSFGGKAVAGAGGLTGGGGIPDAAMSSGENPPGGTLGTDGSLGFGGSPGLDGAVSGVGGNSPGSGGSVSTVGASGGVTVTSTGGANSTGGSALDAPIATGGVDAPVSAVGTTGRVSSGGTGGTGEAANTGGTQGSGGVASTSGPTGSGGTGATMTGSGGTTAPSTGGVNSTGGSGGSLPDAAADGPGGSGGTAGNGGGDASIDAGDASLADLLYDDFNGSIVDANNWHIPAWVSPTDGTFYGQTQQRCSQNSLLPAAIDSNAIVALDSYNPTGASFYGTDLISNQSFQAGIRITVRAKMNAMPRGIVGGIFLYAPVVDANADHDEVDFELLTNDPANVHTNIYGNEPLGTGHPAAASYGAGSIADYHTYEIKWLPSQVSWSVDGTVVRTVTTQSPLPKGPMHVHLNIWVPASDWAAAYDPNLHWADSAANDQTYTMSVDWVEVVVVPAN